MIPFTKVKPVCWSIQLFKGESIHDPRINDWIFACKNIKSVGRGFFIDEYPNTRVSLMSGEHGYKKPYLFVDTKTKQDRLIVATAYKELGPKLIAMDSTHGWVHELRHEIEKYKEFMLNDRKWNEAMELVKEKDAYKDRVWHFLDKNGL